MLSGRFQSTLKGKYLNKSILAYICTSDNNYGMHKCDNLPHYKNSTVECKLTVEEARYKEGCVDWNQV